MLAIKNRRFGTAVAAALAAALASAWVVVSGLTDPVRAADPVVVINHTFEDATTSGWGPRSAEVVASSTAAAHGGSRSLLVSERTASWNGPTLDVLATLELGVRYTLSVWVRVATGGANTSARLSVERRTAGTPSYDQVVGNTAVTSGGWTNLQGSYTLATEVDFLTVYVETSDGTAGLHIDDFVASYLPASPIQTTIPSLKTVFANDFPIGAAVSGAQILGTQAQLLTKHFNTITPGNALKWDATEPTEAQFRWSDADPLVNFGVANGIGVRGHTFVWHQQTPAWVFNDANGQPMTATAANKALLLSRLEAHIRAVGGRYAGKIYAWDVVNEVIDENQSDGLRRSSWFTIAGLDFIRTAFRVAREVDPAAKLYINDYNTNVPAKRDKLYNLVAQLKSEGVPIDGVGHQMHGNVDWPSAADTDAMIAKFIPLEVEQQITEMDISIYTSNSESFPTPPADRLTRQAARYKALFDVYRARKANLTSVTLWGLADDDTWLDTYPVTRKDAPLLFDTQLQAKSAYWALIGTASPTGTASASASPSASPSPSVSASPSQSRSPSPSASASASPSPSASASVPPSPSTPVGPCAVRYTVTGSWPGGFQGEARLTNTGSTGYSSWTMAWSFANGQAVNQSWGGRYSQSAAAVTIVNEGWNGSLAPGASATVGFLASWNNSVNAKPSTITVNGTPCALT